MSHNRNLGGEGAAMPSKKVMAPRERFLAGILGKSVDRTPVGSPTSVATVEQMELTGAFFPKVHQDGAAMAKLASGAHEILDYDAIMPIFSVTQEAAALGCDMDWGTIETMPVAKTHPWSEPGQVRVPEDFLERLPIKAVLDAIQILRHQYGNRVAIVGKVMGPWTLSYHLHGLQDFLVETLLEPEKVRAFLDRLKAIPLLFGNAQVAAGADMLCLADHATGDLVRGTMYRDFLQSIHRELVRDLGCPVVLHICGDTLDRIGYIAEAGFAAFHFDSKVEAKDAVQAAGRMSLVGNVNNTELLLRGTPETVEQHARHAVEAGVRVLAPECAIPLRTPLENLKSLHRAVRRYR
jgi:methylthiol:coenzyme M methyltransferase